MTKLTKRRVAITLLALIGIAPVTLTFIWGLIFFLSVAIFVMDNPAWPIAVIVISVIGLWGCWRAYAAAMSSKPKHPRDWRVITSVVVATVWALPCSAAMSWDLTILFTFLMPGLTAAIMLAVTECRARRNGQNGEVTAIPD
jgi:hypothetical protein